jgi:hypothetical protein
VLLIPRGNHAWDDHRLSPAARWLPTRRCARSLSARVDFDGSSHTAPVATVLRVNGVVDAEACRKLGRSQLRMGMFPAVDPDHVDALAGCLAHIVAGVTRVNDGLKLTPWWLQAREWAPSTDEFWPMCLAPPWWPARLLTRPVL